MKKYCLTDCFKRKMSKFWKDSIQVIAIILLIIFLIVAISGIFYVIGLGFHYFGFITDKEPFETGAMMSMAIGFFVWALHYAYLGIKTSSRVIRDVIVGRYEGTYKCKIFEECKEDKDD